MRRSMAWMAGVLSLTAAVYFGTQLGAKPVPAAAPAPTRVALLNLRLVIRECNRYQQFTDGIKKQEQGYLDTIKAKQQQIDALQKQAEVLRGPELEAREAEIRDLGREIDNVKLDARKDLAVKGNDELAKIYVAVREAATRHARANHFNMVIHYEGPAEKEEVDNPALLMRNMNSGGCVPLYCDLAFDISAPVIDALNAAHKGGGK